MGSGAVLGMSEGKRVQISIDDIDEVRYRGVSFGKSVGLLILGLLALYGVGWVVFILSF